LFEDVQAVHVKTIAQESVHEEQLAYSVGDVENLDRQVEHDQDVTMVTTAKEANGAGEKCLDAERTFGTLTMLADQVSICNRQGNYKETRNGQ